MVDNSATRELVRLRTGREVEPYVRELYVERRWTDQEIADHLKVDRVTVNKWRREWGIARSDRTAALDEPAPNPV
jgi:hypothetical protein